MLDKEYDLPDRVLNDASANTNLAIPQNFQFGVQRLPTFSYFVQTVALNEMGGDAKTVPFAIGPAVLLPGSSAKIGSCVVTFLVSEDLLNYYEIIKWTKMLRDILAKNTFTPPDTIKQYNNQIKLYLSKLILL